MAHSDPAVCDRLERALKAQGGTVIAKSRREFKDKVDMTDVSNTQLDRALGSMHKRRILSVRRPFENGDGHKEQRRSYHVTCNRGVQAGA